MIATTLHRISMLFLPHVILRLICSQSICDADLKSLRDLSAYDVLKPSVGSPLDTSVIKCVKIDECDVLDNVMIQGDDVTLISNADSR